MRNRTTHHLTMQVIIAGRTIFDSAIRFTDKIALTLGNRVHRRNKKQGRVAPFRIKGISQIQILLNTIDWFRVVAAEIPYPVD